jgi:hypothetical protein
MPRLYIGSSRYLVIALSLPLYPLSFISLNRAEAVRAEAGQERCEEYRGCAAEGAGQDARKPDASRLEGA